MGEAGVELTTVEAVVVVVLVLSPGYIFTLVARRLIAHVPESTDLRLLLTVVAYGTVIQALLFPVWTHRILDFYLDNTIRQHANEVYAWAVAACLVVPVALGIVVGRLTLWRPMDRLLDQLGLGYIDRLPSAWDYVARQQHGSWVKIHLKDDRGIVAGIFGPNSVAALAPDRADIYLETVWLLDAKGDFDEHPLTDTRGVWVSHDVMAYVEFFDRWEDDDETNANKNAPMVAVDRGQSTKRTNTSGTLH